MSTEQSKLLAIHAEVHELHRRIGRLEGLAGLQEIALKEPVPEPPHLQMQWIPIADETIPSTLPTASISGPSITERLRSLVGDQEWETLVGGSLLNKLGALVLVIGIALFLGYSIGHVTAAGRAAIAIIVSVSLLGAGVRAERTGQYRVFARGLLGAGWAAIYATSYAIHAIPAARVIHDPFAGSIIVVLVAIGMIWHSLRYESQSITAIAYFAAFAAVAVTPSTAFAVISVVPLAASLLYLAWRFEWHSMALFGLAATYITCMARGSDTATLLGTQSLLLTYWILFEAFDLLRFRRRLMTGALELLSPLNSACFLRLSYLAWSHHSKDLLWLASAFGAVLFLADSLMRITLRLTIASENIMTRVRAGSYESSFLISTTLAALAVVGGVPGVWAGVGLAIEAEMAYLAGIRFRSNFLTTWERHRLYSRSATHSLNRRQGRGL